MVKKGSVTVFLTLMLSLILSLLCTSMESVRMAAARTQILGSLDIGLYSLFGQYDKAALQDFDLFFLDGSCGGGTLKMSNVYHTMESYMKPVLKQNSQKLSVQQGGFTGYQLLTDAGGEIFYNQIIQYMKDTLGFQGAQLLIKSMEDRQTQTENAIERGLEMKNKNILELYNAEMDLAKTSSDQLLEEKKAQEEAARETGEGQGTEVSVVTVPQQTSVKNPISKIKRIMRMGILDLLLPSGSEVSNSKAKKRSLLSDRKQQEGMEMARAVKTDSSYLSQLMYQQYLIQRLGNYQKPAPNGLTYQMEYIVSGKNSDKENLKSVAEKLLLIREGVNLASLLSSPAKRSEAQALAVAIASTFLVPPAAGVIEGALLFCWSFAESVLDVRELFAGGRVPLVKASDQWQLSLGNLPELLSGLDSFRKTADGGLSYEDYLQILLILKGRLEKIQRGMDMIEQSIREKTGNKEFQLDSGVVAIEASVDVKANKRKTFTVTRQYCYE